MGRVRGKRGPGQVQRDHSGYQARIKKEMVIFEGWRAKQKLKQTCLKAILRIFLFFFLRKWQGSKDFKQACVLIQLAFAKDQSGCTVEHVLGRSGVGSRGMQSRMRGCPGVK